MSEYKQHINYTTTDIQRYVQGKLSPAEMHAMEKAALDDPFLADAIEGMQIAMEAHDVDTINGQLQQARDQLQQRVQPAMAAKTSPPAKVVSVAWWKAAAAAAVIVVGGIWIFNTINSDQQPASTILAQKKQRARAPVPQQETAAIQTATDSVVAAVTPSPTRSTAPETKPSKKQSIPVAAADEAPIVAVEKPRTDTILSNEVASATHQKREALRDAMVSRQETQNQVPQQPVPTKQYNDFSNRPTELITIAKSDSQIRQPVISNKALTGVVKGIVTDPFKNPVANAYISYPGTNRYNILTDKAGRFDIPINTSDSVLDVAVNVVGYGTQNFRLQNNASLNEIQLQPTNNPHLNEVVVTGIDKKGGGKYGASYAKVIQQDAEPVYGWIAYEQYLERNKIRPAGFENTTGNVAVSFTVNRKGQLADFKIEKSLAKQLDDEAIRLIAQGPGWKLLRGRKTRMTVVVKF